MKKELLEKIKITAEELNVVSIYLVGLDDGLLISDYDLILVLPKNSSKRKAARAFSSIDKKIDLRLVTNPEYFKNNYKYLPGTEMSLIYGSELRSSVKDSNKMKLIKMSAMFFKSFLRNYYRHSIANNINTVSLLKDLNDFNYCPKYLDDLPDNILVFIDKINNYRLNYDKISQVEARKLLKEAIDNSWLLIEILNIELKKEFLIKNPKYIYFDLEPTIMIPSSVNSCRILTEKSGSLFKKSKILYLPLGFQFVFSKDKIVINYIKNNLKHSFFNSIIFFKTLLKKSVAAFYHFRFWSSGVFEYFSPYEAYSVKSSVSVYSMNDFCLLPSEKESLIRCGVDKKTKILDLGCGSGRTTIAMLRDGYDVIGLDFEEEMIDKARNVDNGLYRDNFIVGSATSINQTLKDKFDIVFFSYNGLDYLYPVELRKMALNSIYNKLNDDGYLIFSEHNSVCINRKYLFIFITNLFNIIFNRKYLVVNQSFGKLLTYFSSPSSICKELSDYGFKNISIVPNVKFMFPYRDPFPYYVFKKI